MRRMVWTLLLFGFMAGDTRPNDTILQGCIKKGIQGPKMQALPCRVNHYSRRKKERITCPRSWIT